MTARDEVQRVRIYLSEREQRGGEPLYLALMELLRREGATGATALRGLAGFGPGYWTRAGGPISLTERPPVVIEWVDRADRIARILPLLDELAPDALMTLEEIRIHRAVLRQRSPFSGEATVGTIMHILDQVARPEMLLSEALALMIDAGHSSLPVLDADGRLAGMLIERELGYRLNLPIPLRLFGLLDQAARDNLLASLIGRSVAQVMNSEPRSVMTNTPIPQALMTMIEQGYDQIAVLERNGKVVGMLGGDDALRASVAAGNYDQERIRTAEPPTPVHLVMQTAGPQVTAEQSLALALEQLLAAPARQIAAIDQLGRLVGLLTVESVLRNLEEVERAVFAAALISGRAAGPLPGADRPVETALERDPPSVAPGDAIIDATRRLLELGLSSVPVVDHDGRLVGMLARGSLIRALIQQGE